MVKCTLKGGETHFGSITTWSTKAGEERIEKTRKIGRVKLWWVDGWVSGWVGECVSACVRACVFLRVFLRIRQGMIWSELYLE